MSLQILEQNGRLSSAFEPIIHKAAVGAIQETQNRPRTVDSSFGPLVERKTAIVFLEFGHQLFLIHVQRFGRRYQVFRKVGSNLFVGIPKQSSVQRIERNVLQVVEGRKNTRIAELGDAGHKKETQAPFPRLQRKKEFAHHGPDFPKEFRIVQALRERSVVFVDQHDQARGRQRCEKRRQLRQDAEAVRLHTKTHVAEGGRELFVKLRTEFFDVGKFFDLGKIQFHHRIRSVGPELFYGQSPEMRQPVSEKRFEGGQQKRFAEPSRAHQENFGVFPGKAMNVRRLVHVQVVAYAKRRKSGAAEWKRSLRLGHGKSQNLTHGEDSTRPKNPAEAFVRFAVASA